MEELSDSQISRFLHRSYGALDGLWFMKVEEKFGFETALELDLGVWKVLPKIQARTLKSMLNLENGLGALAKSLNARLKIDGFGFEFEKESADEIRITINSCPWHRMMEKSGRAHLSGRVGGAVCVADHATWAKEFGGEINFYFSSQLCKGEGCCIMNFNVVQPDL